MSGAAARTGNLKGKERKECIKNRFRTFVGKNKQTTHGAKEEIRNVNNACMSRYKIEDFINSINNKSITNKKRSRSCLELQRGQEILMKSNM